MGLFTIQNGRGKMPNKAACGFCGTTKNIPMEWHEEYAEWECMNCEESRLEAEFGFCDLEDLL